MKGNLQTGAFLKKMLIILCLHISSSIKLFAQDLEFRLYYHDPCNSETELTFNYYLEKNGIEFHPSFEGIVKLLSIGDYNLVHEKEVISINIDNNESKYIIKLSDKQAFIVNDRHGYEYRDCKGPLNGNIIDYFENGKVRLVGQFKDGLVIGYLTEFYPNGELKKIRLFDEKGYLIESVFINN